MMLKRIPKQDYDEQYKVGKDAKILCYSKKQLDQLYPDAAYTIIGETTQNNKKEKIAELQVDGHDALIVSKYGEHKGLLYSTVGYVCVGKDEYVALLNNRFAFLLILLILLAAIIIAVVILCQVVLNPSVPVINPDHPLPDEDPYVEVIPEDETEKVQSESGGGSVSMIYTLVADLDLSSGKANIYFMNPNASNHDVVVKLCVLDDDKEVVIAESGRVQAGYGLYKLDMTEGSAVLSSGVYDAVYKVQYYDPLTGEKALVESTITDVALTVTD